MTDTAREKRMLHINRLNEKEIARKKKRYALKDSNELNRNCIDKPQYNKKIYEAIDASEINIDLQTDISCFKEKCNEKIAWLPSERRFG